jgi:hypothetical protein
MLKDTPSTALTVPMVRENTPPERLVKRTDRSSTLSRAIIERSSASPWMHSTSRLPVP